MLITKYPICDENVVDSEIASGYTAVSIEECNECRKLIRKSDKDLVG